MTYDDGDLPTHYAFKVGSSLEAIEHTYRRLAAEPENHRPLAPQQSAPTKPAMTDALAQQARAALDALDHRGAWVADGRLSYHGDDDPTRQIIDTRTFIRNIAALSQFLAASDD